MKICTKCKRELPESSFYKDIARPDGLHSWCKSCANEQSKRRQAERYREDPEYRKKINERNTKRSRKRYREDADYRERILRTHKKYRNKPETIEKMTKKIVCRILNEHHQEMKDDPERLTTDFLKEVIGEISQECDVPETGQPNGR